MKTILQYFPSLSDQQLEQFDQLGPLYREWNEKINLISRKDIDQLYAHHILHSLAIAKVLRFKPGASVLDLGSGGGLPGIPLAVLFPETNFLLVDGTGKKIKAASAIAEAAGLANVKAQHIRAEELKVKFDFVICRAVATLDKLMAWSLPLLKQQQQHALPNGLLTLKGGQLTEEIKALGKGAYVERFPISEFFQLDYFEDKYVVYVQG
jgi:16S rRNA (guanine527-N7)-methyltransferase